MSLEHITPACQGCKRLLNPLDPKCKNCVNQSNFDLRENELGIGKEMKMLNKSDIFDNVAYLKLGDGTSIPVYIREIEKSYHSTTTYVCEDALSIHHIKRLISAGSLYKNNPFPSIKKVIFNDPATIVYWNDGTKTVVKCHEYDIYDPEKGLAMAISKKALGNQGNYYNTFKEWLPEEEKIDPRVEGMSFGEYMTRRLDELKKCLELPPRSMKIHNGKLVHISMCDDLETEVDKG